MLAESAILHAALKPFSSNNIALKSLYEVCSLMAILFLTNDLMFSSRVSMFAREMGQDFSICSTVDALIDKVSTDETLIIVDLSLPHLEIAPTLQKLRSKTKNLKCIAFAPHVHEAKLAMAVDAGYDEVFSRGQFNSQIKEILNHHLSSPS